MDMSEDTASMIIQARRLRERLLDDRHRPGYHFACPGDIGIPGDPNGAFWANGRYHLMYLYDCRSDGFRWGHISSRDLLHWRAHPDALAPDGLDGGIFSGGAFVDDDGTCYLSYWALPVEGAHSGGIRIARSRDRHYDRWEKFAAFAVPCTEWGVLQAEGEGGGPVYLSCADPGNIWKKGGKYYMQAGNLCVLAKFKRDGLHAYTEEEKAEAAAPADIRGDWTDLYESDDLTHWRHLHRFYEQNAANAWTGEDEDDMCPSFLPLPSHGEGGEPSGKYLQLFISHNRGCQYYIGDYDEQNDRFLPSSHGRMTWADNTFFAPEALVDGRGRQIFWSWLTDNRPDEKETGWSGVLSLPRAVWLREDGALGVAPAQELAGLRYNPLEFGEMRWNGLRRLDGLNGASCELTLEIDMRNAAEAGLYVRAAGDLSEYTKLYYDKAAQALCFDSTRGGGGGRNLLEKAPLRLVEGEKLQMDVYVDHSVIEVFANDRQAVCRRVYPAEGSDGVLLYAKGDAVGVVTGYEMMPANFY